MIYGLSKGSDGYSRDPTFRGLPLGSEGYPRGMRATPEIQGIPRGQMGTSGIPHHLQLNPIPAQSPAYATIDKTTTFNYAYKPAIMYISLGTRIPSITSISMPSVARSISATLSLSIMSSFSHQNALVAVFPFPSALP